MRMNEKIEIEYPLEELEAGTLISMGFDRNTFSMDGGFSAGPGPKGVHFFDGESRGRSRTAGTCALASGMGIAGALRMLAKSLGCRATAGLSP